MKLFKNKVQGGSKLLVFLMSLVLLSTGLTLTTYAYEDGDSVHWTGRKIASSGAYIFNVEGAPGLCVDAGQEQNKTSGTATIERVSNNSLIAKVLYKYVVVEEWHKKINVHHSDIPLDMELLVQTMAQYAVQGEYAIDIVSRFPAFTPSVCNSIRNLVNGASSVQVPSAYRVYIVHTGNDGQDFAIIQHATGYVKVKKASGNTDITG